MLPHPQRYQELLESGDRFDNTPLHVAAMKGHLEIVQMLLNKVADVDRKNEDEQTPLLVAAREGRPRHVLDWELMSIKDIVVQTRKNSELSEM